MQEIRRIWMVDKHDLEDLLPGIYRDATSEDYPCCPPDGQPDARGPGNAATQGPVRQQPAPL